MGDFKESRFDVPLVIRSVEVREERNIAEIIKALAGDIDVRPVAELLQAFAAGNAPWQQTLASAVADHIRELPTYVEGRTGAYRRLLKVQKLFKPVSYREIRKAAKECAYGDAQRLSEMVIWNVAAAAGVFQNVNLNMLRELASVVCAIDGNLDRSKGDGIRRLIAKGIGRDGKDGV